MRPATAWKFGLIAAAAALLALAVFRRIPSRPIQVRDGFDAPELSNLWETTRIAGGALEMQSAVVRAGKGAVKITVRPRDTFEAGRSGSNDSERDEIAEVERLYSREGKLYEQTFSMYFPADFPIVPTRLVIAQWKQNCNGRAACSDDNPVLALRYIGGELLVTQTVNKARQVLYRQKGEFRGRWLDFKVQTRFSSRSDGLVKLWLNGRPLVDFAGITANAESAATGYTNPGTFYFKMGLYRDLMPLPMTVYIDEYAKKELPADRQ